MDRFTIRNDAPGAQARWARRSSRLELPADAQCDFYRVQGIVEFVDSVLITI
jgi:hypothetical protein